MAKRYEPGGGLYFASPKPQDKFIPSGSKLLDLALGGGWARQRVANIIGDKSTGKTLLAIEACANFARILPKGRIRYRETEAAFDRQYAGALGMPLDRVDFGPEKLNTVEDLFEDLVAICKGAKQEELVIVDSLDALSDRAEMKRKPDEGSYGAAKAKQMSELFRRNIRTFEQSKVTIIIVSQVRDAIGVVYGKKQKRSGGHALDFYSSQTVWLAYTGKINRTRSGVKRVVGIKIHASLDKNKVGIPFRTADFRVMFGYGIDDMESCLAWLDETRSLKSLGIKDHKDHLADMDDMSPDQYRAEVKRIHDMCETKWWSIERDFLPTKRKY